MGGVMKAQQALREGWADKGLVGGIVGMLTIVMMIAISLTTIIYGG